MRTPKILHTSAIVAALFSVLIAADATAQGSGAAVYRNCNAPFAGARCTIGVAGSAYAAPGTANRAAGWLRTSQVYRTHDQAWRTACRWHYGNPSYAAPAIANGTINCAALCSGSKSCQ